MLKKAFAVIMILFLMVNLASASLILLDFSIRQAQIAAEKCENKKKPEMKCNGKCYLAKKLKKQAEKEKETPVFPDFKKSPEVVQHFEMLFTSLRLFPAKVNSFYFQFGCLSDPETTSLPPPEWRA